MDYTQQQSRSDEQRARQLSLRRNRPPGEAPGYEAQQFLGSGAYGEVWVGVDQNTGRRVAIKFYLHRGGLDWSLLSREVEKLVFLSADRYVVQLLDVGWDADPPYYVMEYVENGSLDDYLREQQSLPAAAAVDIFRDVAIGLQHAHNKGVLHCDLKPANVLLDQDHKPRLADFGQSRLSHEQTPALGTLFYMAPEQADVEAVPDARWDVYALGALLYCMLVGQPPYRNEEAVSEIDTAANLVERLAKYREIIMSSPPPTEHRSVPGVDRALAEILERCLARHPKKRYENVQAVLEALSARDRVRARRPLMLLGFVGPLLLLAIMGLFSWRGYHRAMSESDAAVTEKAKQSNRFAAKFVAETVAEKLDRYFHAVEEIAESPRLREVLAESLENDELDSLLETLRNPALNDTDLPERRQFIEHEARRPLQNFMDGLINNMELPRADSWFVNGPDGVQLASAFDRPAARVVIGKSFAYRSYFHGGPEDLVRKRTLPDGGVVKSYGLPPDDQRLEHTRLSAVFPSTATNTWKIGISTPIVHEGKFLGVLAMTIELGGFMEFEEGVDSQFAVLVDGREGENRGMILQHPLFDEILRTREKLPEEFSEYRAPLHRLDDQGAQLYRDPLGQAPRGEFYDRLWIAARAPVYVHRVQTNGDTRRVMIDTGLVVLVQEDHAAAVAPVHGLGRRLLREASLGLTIMLLVAGALWYVVVHGGRDSHARSSRSRDDRATPTPPQEMSTVGATDK